MARIILSCVLVFFTSISTAQYISGKIKNKESLEPLPFASISVHSTGKGTITNEDGVYKLKLRDQLQDSLVFSYVGFRSVTVCVNDLLSSGDILLTPSINELSEVVINSEDDFAYQLLNSVVKEYRKDRVKRKSKTFFALESKADQEPLEIIEAFYNSSYSNSYGFNKVELKNGRIGVTDFYNQYYISLNTTDLLENFSVFQPRNTWDQRLPISPANLKPGKMKKLYNIFIDWYSNVGNEEHYVIAFQPLRKGNYFAGKAYINATSMQLEKLELYNDNDNDFIVAINKKDAIDSLKVEMIIEFDPTQGHKQLKNVQLNYSLDYYHGIEMAKRDIETRALFYFYDHKDEFSMPLFSAQSLTSDYDKILTYPYNSLFWSENYVLETTESQRASKRFFKEHGLLVNHAKEAHISEHMKSTFLRWSANRRLNIVDLNSSLRVSDRWKSNFSSLDNDVSMVTLSDMYNIDAQLMLDMSRVNNEVVVHLYTLLDTKSSYYFLEENPSTHCFINLYFDLFEVKRRELQEKFNSKSYNEVQVASIFNNEMQSFRQKLKKYVDEVERGKSKKMLRKWNSYIVEKLQVDNEAIFLSPLKEKDIVKEIAISDPKLKMCIENYNIGTGWLAKGNPAKALEYFNIAIQLNDPSAEVYFNRGVAYYYLGEFEKACEDWEEAARRKDEEVKEIIVEKCDD